MRRSSLVACAMATLTTCALVGTGTTADAARKPADALRANVSVQPNATHDMCVFNVSWVASEPAQVATYQVVSGGAAITSKTSNLQSKTTNETSASWVIADEAAFYVDVSIQYVDGRFSKPLSIGAPAWDCLG
jgi:hypothetical protein